jgi:hypothetical protein
LALIRHAAAKPEQPSARLCLAKIRRACYKISVHQISPRSQAPDKERGIRDAFETFCTQPETRVDFFYFFARNPLKSPDSDE